MHVTLYFLPWVRVFLYRLLKSLSLPGCVSWEGNLLGLHHQDSLAFWLRVGFCKAPIADQLAERQRNGAFPLLVHILYSGYIPLPASWRVAPHPMVLALLIPVTLFHTLTHSGLWMIMTFSPCYFLSALPTFLCWSPKLVSTTVNNLFF